MNDVLKIFMSLSLSGSLLILVLFLCKPILKDRLSKRWQYYVWLVVIVRLLLPFAPATNLIGSTFQFAEKVISQTYMASPPQADTSDLQDLDLSKTNNEEINAQNTAEQAAARPVRDITAVMVHNLWLIWLVTALMLIIRKITIYQSFVQYVEAGRMPVTDTELLDRVAIIGGRIGVKRAVELCVNPLISSPLLIGFFHPCIVLPSTDIPELNFQYTVLHELTHYRQRDMLYKWLVQITICLHWFNPLIYFMGREISKACEFCCDESIIAKLDDKAARVYGKTLLDAMAAAGKYKEAVASVTLSENKELLKERLGAIMSFRKKTRISAVISITLAFVLCFGAAVAGAYVGTSQPASAANGVGKGIKTTKSSKSPVTIDNCKIEFEDTPYAWPYISYKITNNFNKTITEAQIALLAYDKYGNPMELFWDARNVDQGGGHGNVGFGPEGEDYGIVVGIYPYSSKSYDWLIDTDSHIAPGKTLTEGGWSLFDGWWDQPARTHKVKYILSCMKQVTFKDGTVWKNKEYKKWLSMFKEKTVALDTLKSYLR